MNGGRKQKLKLFWRRKSVLTGSGLVGWRQLANKCVIQLFINRAIQLFIDGSDGF